MKIAVLENDIQTKRRKTFPQATGNSHRSMPASGAPDGNRQITALFSLVEGNKKPHQSLKLAYQRDRIRIRQYVGANTRVVPVKRFEIGHKKWIPKKTDIEEQINVVRHAEFVSERQQGDR